MKQTISLALVMILAVSSVFAKDKTRVSNHTTIKAGNISITYGQPSKKGRLIFGTAEQKALVPYGEVWRAGADEATELTISKDCTIAGFPLKAGTYTLFIVPSKGEWQVILNSKPGQWGAFDYEKNKDKDVLKRAVAIKHMNNVVETFTISIKDNGILFEWDQTSAFFPIVFNG